VEKSRLAVLYTIIARAYRRHANEGQRRTDRSRCLSSGRKSTTKQSVAISVPSIADDRLPNNQPRPLIINGAIERCKRSSTDIQTDRHTHTALLSGSVQLRREVTKWRKRTTLEKNNKTKIFPTPLSFRARDRSDPFRISESFTNPESSLSRSRPWRYRDPGLPCYDTIAECCDRRTDGQTDRRFFLRSCYVVMLLCWRSLKITPMLFEAPSPRNPHEYPHEPYTLKVESVGCILAADGMYLFSNYRRELQNTHHLCSRV